MRYEKKALTPDELLYKYWTNGLRISDRCEAARALQAIGHFRLLPYMRRFQNPQKRFIASSSFKDVLDLYEFDRKLRLLVMDATERLEVALRAALANRLGVAYGPHWFMDCRHFNKFEEYIKVNNKINSDSGRESLKSISVKHYYNKYTLGPELPPVWTVLERVTLGALSRLFEHLTLANRKIIADIFNFDETLVVSWFHSLTVLRNICAHHGQIWNVRLTKFPPKSAKAYAAAFTPNDTFYARATVMWLLLRNVQPNATWRDELMALLESCRHVELDSLGFPNSWRSQSAWS